MASLEGRPGIQGRLWGSYLPIVALDQDQLDQGMAPPGISRVSIVVQDQDQLDQGMAPPGISRQGLVFMFLKLLVPQCNPDGWLRPRKEWQEIVTSVKASMGS
eukprot:scaffold46552_cov16-Tisochrysis_lutea.AAC.1